MIPDYWYSTLAVYLWQVSVHSLIIAVTSVIWLKRRALPSGTARRQLLSLILVLPLLTAAVPGRDAAFRSTTAWFDSHRLLLLPVGSRFQAYHFALGLAALVVLLTLWQELMPVMQRRRAANHTSPPEAMIAFARSLPGWAACEIDVHSSDEVLVATGGWPPRPKVHVSTGALLDLHPDEARAVIRHEHAHWREWRWIVSHLLFVVRLVQILNPVALWAFREYAIELEIACDRDAIEGRDRKPLARALFKVYRASHRGEVAARATVRRRIDVLMRRREYSEAPLPLPVFATITLILSLAVPWIV